jgi:hypothetical protein
MALSAQPNGVAVSKIADVFQNRFTRTSAVGTPISRFGNGMSIFYAALQRFLKLGTSV